jgi:hypothetical protein
MIGKTIAHITDRAGEYEGIDIVFTDGTALRIQGDGYETSTVTQSTLTAEDLAREAVERAEDLEEERLRDIERAKRRAADDALKATMTAAEWEAWQDEHRPGWRIGKLMKEEYKGAVLQMMRDANRMFYDGDHHGGFKTVGAEIVIPIFKWEDKD